MSDGAGLRSEEVRRALGIEAAAEGETRRYTGVSTDSRTVEPGHLFVALEGERVHGADFLPEAAARGATGAIVPARRELAAVELELFRVADPLDALGALAAYRRRACRARVVGITGTSGKTTVKEMIAAALSDSRVVHKTEGNLNSQVGLPLCILAASADADVWVLELGASEPGEIARLAEVTSPDDAVVTTVGPAHLEAFGDEAAVLREKLSLVGAARPGGAVVVGESPPVLPREARRIRPDAVVAGLGEAADYRPQRHGTAAERSWFEREGVRYEVAAGGEHHLRDALIAAALADALGVSPESAARGMAGFRPIGLRGAVEHLGPLTVLADCYNANPESFAAAIDYCTQAFPGRRLAAVVGTMLELGTTSDSAHRLVAERLLDAGFSLIAATGEFETAVREAGGARNGTRIVLAPDADDVWDRLVAELEGDEVVLVKGSRGVRLERIVERLRRRFGNAAREERPRPSGEEA